MALTGPAGRAAMCPRGEAMLEAGCSRSLPGSWKRGGRDAADPHPEERLKGIPPNTLVQRFSMQRTKINILSIFLTTSKMPGFAREAEDTPCYL